MEQDKIKNICGYEFDLVEEINLVRNEDGEIYTYNNSDKYKKKDQYELFEHCKDKLFCKFRVGKELVKVKGVYIIVVVGDKEENIKYVGITKNFASRWNSTNYGLISPRNCYVGGQSTNCKVNNKIYEEIRDKRKCFVYLHRNDDAFNIETMIIDKIKNKNKVDLWNIQKNSKKIKH